MYDIQKMNIWKNTPVIQSSSEYLEVDIAELGLGVRSFNCLKRASCNTVGDVIAIMESEKGLLSIRNLGKTSLVEITDKIDELRESYSRQTLREKTTKKTVIKPAKKMWDMEIEAFGLSNYARMRLKNCGIEYIRDLYTKELKADPGWTVVRELFERIPV